jgi:hypothetical protein
MEILYKRFVREKRYLRNVSPRTVDAYHWAWKAFEPALGDVQASRRLSRTTLARTAQRGTTDGDDPLDLIIKLSARDGWKAGDGLQFKLDYEKVRRGDKLEPLKASTTAYGSRRKATC